MKDLDQIERELLHTIADVGFSSVDNQIEKPIDAKNIPLGAYNFRLNGKSIGRQSSANIDVCSKKDGSGLNIHILPNTKDEAVHIPVIISTTGHQEVVYNEFFIGENCEVTIVAGCGIYNCGANDSIHNGVHTFHVGKNSKVRYIEKHYGSGPGAGKILNPVTKLELAENSYVELELEQIRGVDSTRRETSTKLAKNAKISIVERLLTHGRQTAESHIEAFLDGENSTADIVSRSVARDQSSQAFTLHIVGSADCRGHSECDAIIMDSAKVLATPSLDAQNPNAELIHEAAIGKIASAELTKLMTLGLTRPEAEAQIINSFLR